MDHENCECPVCFGRIPTRRTIMRKIGGAAIGLPFIGAAFAAEEKSGEDKASDHKVAAKTDHKPEGKPGGGHWTYEGAGGPENWGKVSPEYSICNAGKRQSPVDISGLMDAELADIRTDYMVSATKTVNNGHTVQFNYLPGSQMIVGERTLHLLQFHFHAPSEHTLFGRRFDMEMHLVHKDDWGNLGVLGVFMKKGERNSALQKLWDTMPQEAGGERNGPKVNVADLLPPNLRYYRYAGSLTTPPCSEGVSWFVAREPITVSEEQVKQFVKAVPASSRPVQARFDRPVLGMR